MVKKCNVGMIYPIIIIKGVYPSEYMDNWEKFNETSLPEKDFYSQLNIEDITDSDYMQGKRVYENFDTKKKLFKVFILLNTWIIGKNSMKHHYQRKIFTVN